MAERVTLQFSVQSHPAFLAGKYCSFEDSCLLRGSLYKPPYASELHGSAGYSFRIPLCWFFPTDVAYFQRHEEKNHLIPLVSFSPHGLLAMVDLVERINVLLEQEFFSYRTEDYLDPDFQQKLIDDDVGIVDQQTGPRCSKQSIGSTSTSGINEVWREKICEWSYQVIDHYDFSREVVGIALSYLDRYLCKRSVNKKHFQLLAMTCLYLAIKIYEPGTISMKAIIGLSRGYFVVEQMVEMEMAVLR